MTPTQQQDRIKAILSEPVLGMVLPVLAAAGSITFQGLYDVIHAAWAGHVSRQQQLETALRFPLIESHPGSPARYSIQSGYRAPILEYFQRTNPDQYRRIFQTLLHQQQAASANLRIELWWSEVREALYRSGLEPARARRLLEALLQRPPSNEDARLVRKRMLEYGLVLESNPLVRPYAHQISLVERLVQQGQRNTWLAKLNLVEFAINANGDIAITVDKSRRELYDAICGFVQQLSDTPVSKNVTVVGHYEVTYTPLS